MSGQSSEVIHCPNCKEDVPRTLYCLNCGYPLYKLEQQKKADQPVEELEAESEHVPVEEVDMSVEIEQPESVVTIGEPELEPEPELKMEEEVEEEAEKMIEMEPEGEPEEEPIPEPEPEIETTILVEEESEEEPMPEPEPEMQPVMIFEDEPEPEEKEPEVIGEVETYAEPEVEMETYTEPEMVMEEPGEEPEPVVEPEAESAIFTPEERESYLSEEVKIQFAPDPLTKEVMENLAKNITLKIRIVRLLRESQVKEETFKKLFDSYVDQGRLWVERRDEIIRRFKADIDRMEHELVTARKDFELLEIRKSIGDAGDEEYNVKAPAYKWDIENLEKEIKNTRSGIRYVINLKGLIPEDEVAELMAMANSGYRELEVDGVTAQTIARMKESLAEALNSIQN